jgi:glycosyltransferase involved in cell wall biosynthesis
VAELQSAGVTVKTIGDFFRRDLNLLRAAASSLADAMGQEAASTLVHAHSAMPAAVARWAGAGTVVMTCHGMMPGRSKEFDLQDALAIRMADALVSPSRHWAERLRADFNAPPVSVVPDGLDAARHPPIANGGRLTARASRLVTVCELTHRKGIDLLIAAMPRVWSERPDVTLDVLGSGDQAESLARLAAAVDPAGTRIRLLGHVARPYFALAGYDVFVLPTRSDNFPAALAEAMFAGLPVIGTDVGGVPEMIRDGNCGLVVPPESSDALATAILRMSGQDEKGRRAQAAAGEAYARRHLTTERVVNDLASLYASATATSRARTERDVKEQFELAGQR